MHLMTVGSWEPGLAGPGDGLELGKRLLVECVVTRNLASDMFFVASNLASDIFFCE